MHSALLNDLLDGRRYPTDLLLALSWAALAVIGVLALPDGNPARVALGIPLLIFIPGYLAVCALWPRRYQAKEEAESAETSEDEQPQKEGIDGFERIALSFGLSIVIVPLLGLVLNYVWNISLMPILVSIFGFVIVTACIAWYMRARLPEEERFHVSMRIRVSMPSEWTRADKCIAGALAISLIAAGGVLAYVIIVPAGGEHFTEFYILDQNRTLKNLPTNFTVNKTATIIIGVVCHEYQRTNYTVVIRLLNMTGERQNITIGSYDLVLAHGEKDERPFSFSINQSGEYKLKLQLYKGDQEYLECHLWVRVDG